MAAINPNAKALKSATTNVDVSAATAPSSGQVLTATGASAATWQTAGGGTWALKASGTGTSDFTISSLDLDTDQLYKLTIYSIDSGGTTLMTFNNNTTNSYETTGVSAYRNGGAITGGYVGGRDTTGIELNRASGGEPQTGLRIIEILIAKSSGQRPVAHISYAGATTASNPTEAYHAVGTLESTTNVTSIEVNLTGSPTIVRYWLEKIGTTV